MLRLLQRYPATAIQGILWTAIYLGMLSQEGTITGVSAASGWQIITRLSGDVHASDLYSGQPWRFMTANFLHYSALHLVINLVGLVQLGRLVEDWYGWKQTLLLCLLIGLFGNLASAGVKLAALPVLPDSWDAVRAILGQSVDQPSAGGSVIICGLVGLIGVVGGRSKTRFGSFVKGQMITVLVFTLGLGIALPIIARNSPVMLDNLGHAGGALIGGLFGLVHKRMLRRHENGSTRFDGTIAVALILASVVLQAQTYGTARAEINIRIAEAIEKRRAIQRELLFNELRLHEQLGALFLGVSRLYEMTAKPPVPTRNSPLERATSRWAYRAEIPAHQTLLPLRWQWEIEPEAPTAFERRTLLRGLQRAEALSSPLHRPDAPAAYTEWVGLVARALYARPSPSEYARFIPAFKETVKFLGDDLQKLRRTIEELGPPESLEPAPAQPTPAANANANANDSDSNPIGDGDPEQAEPSP